MRFFKVLILFLLFLFLFIAAWQNIPPILEHSITFRLNLYWASWESKPIPIYLIIPLCFFSGLVIMGLVDLGTILRLRREVRRLNKALSRVPSEGESLLPEPSTGSSYKKDSFSGDVSGEDQQEKSTVDASNP